MKLSPFGSGLNPFASFNLTPDGSVVGGACFEQATLESLVAKARATGAIVEGVI